MTIKQVHFVQALVVFLGLFALIATGMFVLDHLLHVVLFAGLVWVVAHAMWLGFDYRTIREMMNGAISRALPAIYIFLLIGLVIAALMQSGTVATLIFYGLDWLSPALFLPVGFVLCALMSLLTGTSWGTVGTLGVVFMGMGEAMGMPLYWVAGMVVAGATFGDKMSPISDTTNLAAMSAETDLYAHIRSMMLTTIPTFVLVTLLFAWFGMGLSESLAGSDQIQLIQNTLAAHFNVNPWLTIWPVVVLAVMSYRRFEPELSMTACVVVAVVIALWVQGVDLKSMAHALWQNQAANTDVASLNDLLGRGGLYSMAWTLLLALIAIALGGVLQGAGFVMALLGGVVERLERVGSLVAATIGTGLLSVAALGEGYIAIILNSQLYQRAYKKLGLNPAMLSRSVEEGVTLLAGLIPWTTAGAFYAATLGISVVEMAPYALLNWLNPLVAIVFAFLGVAVLRAKSSA